VRPLLAPVALRRVAVRVFVVDLGPYQGSPVLLAVLLEPVRVHQPRLVAVGVREDLVDESLFVHRPLVSWRRTGRSAATRSEPSRTPARHSFFLSSSFCAPWLFASESTTCLR